VILGIPAAIVLARIGPKRSGLIALGCTMAGSAIGGLADAPATLLLGRVVEGVGLSLIAVIAPAIISMWFPPAERGTPMGVWASWIPVGSFLMFNLARPLLGSFGWQGSWWFGALFASVAFVIYAAVVRLPETTPAQSESPPPGASIGMGKMLLNPASWILALVFGAFNFSFLAFSTWMPSYLSQSLGMDPGTANSTARLAVLAVIPSTLIAGRVLDRVKNRSRVLSVGLFVAGVFLIWSFQLSSPGVAVPYLLALGLVIGFIPTAAFTLAPESVPHPQFAGLALGIVSVGQNLGMFVGPPVVGAAIGDGNWGAGIFPMILSLAVGAAASLALKPRRRIETPATIAET